MEKRLILAIVLTIVVIFVTNLLFPPAPPQRQSVGRDTARDTAVAADTVPPEGGERDTSAPTDTPRAPAAPGAAGGAPAFAEEEPDVPEGDTVAVSTPLYELRFSTRGAALTRARLLSYESYAPNGEEGRRVQLVREGDRILGYRVAVGGDTVDLRDRLFETSARQVRLPSDGEPDSVRFVYRFPDTRFAFAVTYRFQPDSYVVDVRGELSGLRERGYTLLSGLGHGLKTNASDPEEDFNNLEYVARERQGGVGHQKLRDVEAGTVEAAEGGPFSWVAVRNKYFLAALVAPEDGPGFGGLVARGVPAENSAELTGALPVPAGNPEFRFRMYLGPQEYDRLSAVGQGLEGVNPYGWDWLQPVIRPLVAVIMVVLTWMHSTLSLAYGWVLILFGIMVRVVLFPLYQKSMRAQMKQMQVQPLMKELQDKYEDDPQKLQQEMMSLYKEHDINPLAGCLPMLLPFPVLITLFFVFQNTIEFRGVPFLWIPDLSLADPYYIIPVIMGLSMFLMQWIGQRGMEQNTQMKLMRFGMPVVLTLIFLQFPAGLNLYYATSNLASLPQQAFLAKERQEAQKKQPAVG